MAFARRRPHRVSDNRPAVGFAKLLGLILGTTLLAPMAAAAQAQDPTGLKRMFLDRYLDCAEAPDDAARLDCYDALLADIPAWLADPNDPPPALRTHAPQDLAPSDRDDSR